MLSPVGKTKKQQAWDKYLHKHYYSPSFAGSFSSLDKFWNSILLSKNKPDGLTRSYTGVWLKNQDVASVYKVPKIHFRTQKIISPWPHFLYGSDLADLSSLKKYNDGISFLLIIIDVFTKKTWVRPLLDKKAQSMVKAFQSVFNEGNICTLIHVDEGKEYKNRWVRQLFEKYKVKMYSTFTKRKSSVAERMIRTLKTRLFKYMYHNQTFRYINDLENIVESYNNTIHRTTGMTPNSVNESNAMDLYLDKYMKYVNETASHPETPTYKIGDYVRVVKNKTIFKKGYEDNYSEIIYKVIDIHKTNPPRYILADTTDYRLPGTKYKDDLVPIYDIDKRYYRIDQVLRSRKIRGRKEFLVSWLGHPSRFNSWVRNQDIKKYSA